MSGAVHPLAGHQRDAVDPRESVWLSASAGTGKTQVLSARVLRLLLEAGADPSQILCLTFTKAGAAEMAVRVGEVLARWVRLKDDRLAVELGHLGAAIDPETLARARSLFARVLDCPGGGLRIDTIHAFAQYLLAAFPAEAQILPGSQPMDDRERDLLSRDILAELLADERRADFREAVAEMSRRKGADAVRGWLMRCAGYLDLWYRADWQNALEQPVRRFLGVPSDAGETWVAEACGDGVFPVDTLRACVQATDGWKAQIADKVRDFVPRWIALDTAGRLEALNGFYDTLLKKDGEPRAMKGAEKNDPDHPAKQQTIAEAVRAVRDRRALLDLAAFLAPQLEAGRTFALAWQEAKAREGLVDFDDLIARAAHLLSNTAMADWIRYKLDRSFDHILIDEAQDTNRAQWQIIDALTDDFFSGEGAQGDRVRTIFTVGDFKQAIFGFQGTSPRNFSEARDRVAERMRQTADAAGEMRGGPRPRYLQQYGLGQSFRTAENVLTFVDRAIAAIGSGSMGLDRGAEPHMGQDRPGLVALWNVIHADSGMEEGAADETWLGKHDRKLADRIARQVRRWMALDGPGFPLVKGDKPRRAGPGDVMILVRKRRDLASLIVARLHRHGVPVAGIDRLRLGNPLAVKDLMAALRFAAQPFDDLTLAALLVSPLIGWSQEDLLEHAYRPKDVRLWNHLRKSETTLVVQTLETLREILRRADFDSPQQLLHYILVGPMDGRRKLVARLGREANDPIDELLNAAHAYAASRIASLQGFIRWFDAGEGEVKREAGEGGDQVRVMTVHGSKGLQAPIVILADAAIAPDRPGELELPDRQIGGTRDYPVPIPGVRKEEKVGPLALADAEASAAELEEHWRLLYVAMTRAEEALFITGSLGPRDAKSGPHEDSWYARLKPLFEDDALEDDIWGARWEFGALADVSVPPAEHAAEPVQALPNWALRPVGPEPRPPRPLSPSGLGEVEGSDPPFPPEATAVAARRGTLIHALLERLPNVPLSERRTRAETWLAKRGDDLAEDVRAELLDSALTVLDTPEFADIFSPDALAEIPLAATVEGQVVMGTADRLLIREDAITVVDFKTARRPPTGLDGVPDATMRQMAAYVAALEAIYPGRSVSAAVLYTQTPQIIVLPPDALARYKAAFPARQESFALPPVE
ncbi:double-strand break repair helicase AddA [Erythrobacter litoralis]|uniref:double-strand break repair helicase AddA n=1 Tax=Erythrobacter litoralis TaxID=39960 RepID=UPI002434B7F4|nr:double-strand break repair helicase AddA [Erythrobacter litoralis]MDG6079790.1 double-strand break repair helicase AddA [Erythrobacter litoralis]